MKIVMAFFSTALAVTFLWSADESVAKDKAKYTIKEVMQKAHSGGKKSLLFRIAGGMADKQDAEKLLELYSALSMNTPPKGDETAWKERTDVMVAAAKDVVAGKDGAGAKLQESANCSACHKVFKGK